MKLLITGGNGMVGRNLVDIIDKRFDYLVPSSTELNLLEYNEIEMYFLQYKPDCVVHLAADVGGLYKNMNNTLGMFENNIIMNTNIVKACRVHEIKDFYTLLSTCVFPDKTSYPLNQKNINGGEPHPSNEGYAYAKRMLERHVQYVRDAYKWNWKCFIPVNIFGKYDNFDVDEGHVVPALIHKAFIAYSMKQPFVINGDGSALRQFVSASNVAEVLYNEITGLDNTEHNAILCGTGEYSIKFIAHLIGAYYNIEDIVFDDTFSSGQYKKTVLPTLHTDFQEELRKTMEWFCDNYLNVRGTNK